MPRVYDEDLRRFTTRCDPRTHVDVAGDSFAARRRGRGSLSLPRVLNWYPTRSRDSRTRIRCVTRSANRMKRLYSCVPRRRRVKKDSRSRTSHGHKVNPFVERGVKRGRKGDEGRACVVKGTGKWGTERETERERRSVRPNHEYYA